MSPFILFVNLLLSHFIATNYACQVGVLRFLWGCAWGDIVLMPAHLVLTRVQASLLPTGEKIIVPIDQTLRRDENGGGYNCPRIDLL